MSFSGLSSFSLTPPAAPLSEFSGFTSPTYHRYYYKLVTFPSKDILPDFALPMGYRTTSSASSAVATYLDVFVKLNPILPARWSHCVFYTLSGQELSFEELTPEARSTIVFLQTLQELPKPIYLSESPPSEPCKTMRAASATALVLPCNTKERRPAERTAPIFGMEKTELEPPTSLPLAAAAASSTPSSHDACLDLAASRFSGTKRPH